MSAKSETTETSPAPVHDRCSSSGLTVSELIEQLESHNPKAIVRFSVADDSSEDPGERWFCENGIEDMFGNGHPELPKSNETEVTICLVGKSNLDPKSVCQDCGVKMQMFTSDLDWCPKCRKTCEPV